MIYQNSYESNFNYIFVTFDGNPIRFLFASSTKDFMTEKSSTNSSFTIVITVNDNGRNEFVEDVNYFFEKDRTSYKIKYSVDKYTVRNMCQLNYLFSIT